MAVTTKGKTTKSILDYLYRKVIKPGGMDNLTTPEMNRAREWLIHVNSGSIHDPYGREYTDFRDAYERYILEVEPSRKASKGDEGKTIVHDPDWLPELVTLTQEEYDKMFNELEELRLKVKMLESQDSFYEKLKIDDMDLPF